MRSLGDVLAKKDFIEPPEIKIIKKYIRNKFNEDVVITVKPKQIIISAANSSLAGTLRMHIYDLTKLCKTDKRLSVRVGQ